MTPSMPLRYRITACGMTGLAWTGGQSSLASRTITKVIVSASLLDREEGQVAETRRWLTTLPASEHVQEGEGLSAARVAAP